MKITEEELNKIKPINNWVLVKTHRQVKGTNLIDYRGLIIDGSYNVGMHAPIACEVIKCPDKIVSEGFTEQWWATEMELKEGDDVMCGYLAITNALGLEPEAKLTRYVYTEQDGDRIYYLWIPYAEMFVAKRGKEIIPLNGYVLCEPLEEKRRTGGLMVTEASVKASDRYATVKYIGKPNIRYDDYRFVDFKDEECDIKVGDIVNFDKSMDIPLEFPLHQDFLGGERLYRLRRLHLLGVFSHQEVES